MEDAKSLDGNSDLVEPFLRRHTTNLVTALLVGPCFGGLERLEPLLLLRRHEEAGRLNIVRVHNARCGRLNGSVPRPFSSYESVPQPLVTDLRQSVNDRLHNFVVVSVPVRSEPVFLSLNDLVEEVAEFDEVTAYLGARTERLTVALAG